MDQKLVKTDNTSSFEAAYSHDGISENDSSLSAETANQDDQEKHSAHNFETEISNNSSNFSAVHDFKEKPMENLTGDFTRKDSLLEKSKEQQKNDRNISSSNEPKSSNGKEKCVEEVCFSFIKETNVQDNLNSNAADGNSKKINDVTDDENDDTTCGIGSFRPQWIQKFATARTYLILYCILGVLQGSFYTYFIGTLSTVEKRFAFKSKISGTILIIDEISPLVLGVFVGYFGGKAHRIRLIAIGMFLSTLCCFVSALPYFIYGEAQHLTSLGGLTKTEQELCNNYVGMDPCNSDDRPPTVSAILLFILAHFLKGFGSVAYYTVGLSYMDDNARKKNTPMYFAVTFALRLLGPLLGFLMSSAFLKLYENPFVDPGFGPDDPRWIGAWWIGFCLQGILLAIVTFPIFLFPRRLKKQDKSQTQKGDEEKEKLLSLLLGFFRTMKRICKNPVFVLIVVNATLEIGSFGHYVMLPKYMENQFRLNASDANLYSGPPGIVAVMASVITGGFLIWKYRPNVKIILMGMVITQVLSAVSYLILMIPQCEKVEMSNFGQDEKGLILEGPCNMNCSCTQSAFSPVCGPDGKTTYFTPCYGGCRASLSESSSTSGKKEFFDCSCVADFDGEQNIEVTEGFCVAEGCWSQALAYIIFFPFLQMVASVFRVSHTILLLRSVHPRDKSAALGGMESGISLLGFLPYLVVFGSLVDSTCLVWEEKCGETGNCWFYDMDRFSYLLHGSSAICAFLSALCCLAVYFLSARIRDLYDDDEDDDQQNKATELSEVEKTTSLNTKI